MEFLERIKHCLQISVVVPEIFKFEKSFKDVRANCFCASLLRTQIHMPCHA